MIAAAISVLTIGWGLSESANYEWQAQDEAAQYTEYTYDHVGDACVRAPAIDKADCIEKARHEQRAYERDEQDLVAQKKSALWAYIMGAAAVVGMGLSVVGVYLVYTTFQETRRANEIARDSHLAQQRPWVSIHDLELISLMVSDHVEGEPGNSLWATFRCNLKNSGETPALCAHTFAKGLDQFNIPMDHPISEEMRSYFSIARTNGFAISPNGEVRHEYAVTVDAPEIIEGVTRTGMLSLIIGLSYVGPDCDQARRTIQTYSIGQRQAEGIATPSGLDLATIKAAGFRTDPIPITPLIRPGYYAEMT